MEISTIHQAKTQLSRLIEKAERGEEVIIARGKRPVVRLVPVEKPAGERPLGLLKGKFVLPDSFFDPLPESELEAWE